jgi:hypothetical protein
MLTTNLIIPVSGMSEVSKSRHCGMKCVNTPGQLKFVRESPSCTVLYLYFMTSRACSTYSALCTAVQSSTIVSANKENAH